MRLDDFRVSDNVEDRRGQGPTGGGGGLPIGAGGLGIGGVIVVLAISYFTGINPAVLINGYEQVGGGGYSQQAPQQQGSTQVQTQGDGKFVAQVLGSTEDVWTDTLPQQANTQYRKPRLVLFSGSTDSGCGDAQTAMGPFYCPNDQRVYLDTEFFDEMKSRFHACPPGQGACAFAQAYVIAHEVGHHVQNLLGILPKVHQMQQEGSEAQSNALSVRLELQADCFAGVWANRAQARWNFIQPGDVEAALQTASAIGDDTLEKQAQGYAVPDSFTHGSSAQRQHWFSAGLKGGTIQSCNTFGDNAL